MKIKTAPISWACGEDLLNGSQSLRTAWYGVKSTMAAIIRNSSRLSLKACQLNLNSWRPGSEYMVTLDYFTTLGRSGVCASWGSSEYWSQGDDRMCSSCWGPPHKTPLHLLICFLAQLLSPWTLGVKYRISIFSADSITSSGILLSRHRWPLLVNGAPVCLLWFYKEAGEKLSLRPLGAS